MVKKRTGKCVSGNTDKSTNQNAVFTSPDHINQWNCIMWVIIKMATCKAFCGLCYFGYGMFGLFLMLIFIWTYLLWKIFTNISFKNTLLLNCSILFYPHRSPVIHNAASHRPITSSISRQYNRQAARTRCVRIVCVCIACVRIMPYSACVCPHYACLSSFACRRTRAAAHIYVSQELNGHFTTTLHIGLYSNESARFSKRKS